MTGKWWAQTAEWVGAVTAAAVLTAVGSGVHGAWALIGIGAAAAGATLVKCLAASRTGEGSPALVEPEPVVRPVAVDVSAASPVVTEEMLRQVREQARRQGRGTSL